MEGEKYQPPSEKEKAGVHKSRLLSDAEKVVVGAELDSEGRVLFRERQIESARREMENQGKDPEDPINKSLAESDKKAEMLDELNDLRKEYSKFGSPMLVEIAKRVLERMTKTDLETFNRNRLSGDIENFDRLLPWTLTGCGFTKNPNGVFPRTRDELFKWLDNEFESSSRYTEHTKDLIRTLVADSAPLNRMFELSEILEK